MTPKRRLEVFVAGGGRCAHCRVKVFGSAWRADHILALAKGGSDEIGNLQILCLPCDRPKTAGDITDIAKIKRLIKKNSTDTDENLEPSRSKRRILSAGFDRTKTRRMDGTVVAREARQ